MQHHQTNHPSASAEREHELSVDPFDRTIWQELHENIDNPAAAIAVIDMAADLPILRKLFPALIVRAHQTLIEEERRLERQRTRWDKIRAMLGWIFRPRAKASTVRSRLVQQPRNRSVFPKGPF